MAEAFSSQEAHLFLAAAINVLVLFSAWRMARRFNADRLDAAVDTGLLFYLVQYVSVCSVGLLGCLNVWTIIGVATLLSVAMLIVGARPKVPGESSVSSSSLIIFSAAAAFFIGYVVWLVLYQRAIPVISNDAITYHLPAAVQWLQTGRLGFYPAWFYNPANSYSPLAGSVFIAWLLARFRNDVLARFVQAGPLLLLFLAMANWSRRLGADLAVAGLIATAAVLARPFVSQTALAKDDLFVAAFFMIALDGLRSERMGQRFGPWRAGIALGLLLATKFTALLSLPLLFLVLGRGRKWYWAMFVFVCVMILAGPWYLRNAVWTGNAFYPTRISIDGITLLPGMLNVGRSDLLKSVSGIWHVFTGGYYSLPIALAIVLMVGWIGAVVGIGKRIRCDRAMRATIIGAPLGIAIFILLAPYGEMRFAYPAVLLLFAATLAAILRLPRTLQIALSAIIALLAGATAFKGDWSRDFLLAAAVSAAIVALIAAAMLRWPAAKSAVQIGVMVGCVALAMYAYVNFKRYVIQCQANSSDAFTDAYGDIGEIWRFVREAVPKGAPVAYANTYFTYPLMGFAYDHQVLYVPTRDGLDDFRDMPEIDGKMTGEQIVARVVASLQEDPDRDQWLNRMRASKAQYLVISKKLAETKSLPPPPELKFASELSKVFAKQFENDAGVVYRIRR